MFQPEHASTRSQDLEHAYHDAGQFYWGTRQAWLSAHEIFGPASRPVILPRHRVQDIDTPEDWERARVMFLAMRSEANSGQ
jgi:N-acylneuraminate cytidylyltransferase